jgi:hypothetical protein
MMTGLLARKTYLPDKCTKITRKYVDRYIVIGYNNLIGWNLYRFLGGFAVKISHSTEELPLE